jgi:hypothetical protein
MPFWPTISHSKIQLFDRHFMFFQHEDNRCAHLEMMARWLYCLIIVIVTMYVVRCKRGERFDKRRRCLRNVQVPSLPLCAFVTFLSSGAIVPSRRDLELAILVEP